MEFVSFLQLDAPCRDLKALEDTFPPLPVSFIKAKLKNSSEDPWAGARAGPSPFGPVAAGCCQGGLCRDGGGIFPSTRSWATGGRRAPAHLRTGAGAGEGCWEPPPPPRAECTHPRRTSAITTGSVGRRGRGGGGATRAGTTAAGAVKPARRRTRPGGRPQGASCSRARARAHEADPAQGRRRRRRLVKAQSVNRRTRTAIDPNHRKVTHLFKRRRAHCLKDSQSLLRPVNKRFKRVRRLKE